jgi:hypothetical protein
MAAKKKAVKKSAKPTAPAKVRTKFMADFTSAFIGSKDVPLWPAENQSNPSIVADFMTIVGILIAAEVTLTPPPSGSSGSLADRVGNFLIAQGWPSTSAIPKHWRKIQPTVHLIEISVIADRLLAAINSSPGRGGHGSGWPPH